MEDFVGSIMHVRENWTERGWDGGMVGNSRLFDFAIRGSLNGPDIFWGPVF